MCRPVSSSGKLQRHGSWELVLGNWRRQTADGDNRRSATSESGESSPHSKVLRTRHRRGRNYIRVIRVIRGKKAVAVIAVAVTTSV